MTLSVLTSQQACELHRRHAPKNQTVEFHHIVPVAWQLHTTLPATEPPPSPGPDPDGRGMLWDNRGVWVDPTGHRNVHYWIVAMMHQVASSGNPDPQAAQAAVKKAAKLLRTPVELTTAQQALVRFSPYGQLLDLTAAGEWGQS